MTIISCFYPFLPSAWHQGNRFQRKLLCSTWVAKPRSPQIDRINGSESVCHKEDDEWKQFHPFPAISQLFVRCFCGFFPESWWRPFLKRPRPLTPSTDAAWRPGTSVDVFLNRGRAVRKSTQASASQKKRWQQQAPRCSGRETIALISCIVLLWFFFSLGFKFCCMVLRVANARALVIDLRRLCYLQPVQWITTQPDSEN